MKLSIECLNGSYDTLTVYECGDGVAVSVRSEEFKGKYSNEKIPKNSTILVDQVKLLEMIEILKKLLDKNI